MGQETSDEALVAAIRNAARNLRITRDGEHVIATGIAGYGVA